MCRKHYSEWRKTEKSRPCSVDGCGGLTGIPGTARGLCQRHYNRLLDHGDPLAGGTPHGLSAASRIKKSVTVDPDTGCWNWDKLNKYGYGYLLFRRQSWLAHRLAWLEYRGELVEGMHIDHLCANRACCNPEHLDQVDPLENSRRRDERLLTEYRQARRSRLKPPYPMKLAEFLSWSAAKGIEPDRIWITFGYATE